MGYSIYRLETDFFMAKAVHEKALFCIKKFAREKLAAGRQIAFADAAEIEQLENLEDTLMALRWIPETNETDDITDLDFSGEKAGDDFELFSAIAEYVRDGSYISFVGEDSKVWRWLFLNGRVIEQAGRIVFAG